MAPQLVIATYTTGHGDSFVASDLAAVRDALEDLHGGEHVTSLTRLDYNGCGSIGWCDNCECEFIVDVVSGEFYGNPAIFNTDK